MKTMLNIAILAAGQGKRMHSRLPKVLHSLAGRPLIDHVLDTAAALKPRAVCVVYGHGGEQVPAAIHRSGVHFARQDPQLGTGHALEQALPHLGRSGTTLVLYGDVPLVRRETLENLIEGPKDCLRVLTAQLDDPTGYGRIIRDRHGRIKEIVEQKDASAAQRKVREINTGIMALPAGRIGRWLKQLSNDNAQGEFYLTDVVRLALTDGVPVEAVCIDDATETLGVNSRQQLAQLERIYQWRAATRLLEGGVTLIDPMRIDVRGNLACGEDVTIDINCIFEGRVKLGDGVSIGANVVLRDVEVGANTRIEPFTHAEDALIGEECRIGPYARLRPGTRLAKEVHIGNFVEVKASTIGARSKANHLSYVGDASVGADVNIGAGTITCNYDGAAKHRTIIEDDVHIGSDVQLVAPVTVARGTTIGAGTTVWKETPPGGLLINPKSQEHRPAWKRPVKKKSGA